MGISPSPPLSLVRATALPRLRQADTLSPHRAMDPVSLLPLALNPALPLFPLMEIRLTQMPLLLKLGQALLQVVGSAPTVEEKEAHFRHLHRPSGP
jgi:hypothetical protein